MNGSSSHQQAMDNQQLLNFHGQNERGMVEESSSEEVESSVAVPIIKQSDKK